MFMGLIIAVVAVFLFFLKNTAWVVRNYKAYYEEKRKAFSWLANWEKQNSIDTAKIRANECISGQILMSALVYFGISIAGGWLLNVIIRFISSTTFAVNWLPGDIGYIVYQNIGSVLALIVAFIVSNKIWEDNYTNPGSTEAPEGIALECPSCKCPHSWGLTRKKITILKEWQEKKVTKTTTTRSQSADSFGGGAIGQMFASAGSSSSTSTTVEIIEHYEGKIDRAYQCLNCGTKNSKTENRHWTGKEGGRDRPDETEELFDPQKPAWNIGDGGGLRFIRIGIIIVLAILVYSTVSNIISELSYESAVSKENKAKAEAMTENLDSSAVNIGTAVARRATFLRSAPSPEYTTLAQISKGTLVLLTNEFVLDDFGENPRYIKVVAGDKTGWIWASYLKMSREAERAIKKQIESSGVPKPVVITAKTTSFVFILNEPGDSRGDHSIKKGRTVILTGNEKFAKPQFSRDDKQIQYSEVKYGEVTGWVCTEYLKK